jgi:hypothetical protein
METQRGQIDSVGLMVSRSAEQAGLADHMPVDQALDDEARHERALVGVVDVLVMRPQVPGRFWRVHGRPPVRSKMVRGVYVKAGRSLGDLRWPRRARQADGRSGRIGAA